MEEQLIYEMDCFGKHRILAGESVGRHTLYEFPAFMEKDGKMYVAFTAFYESSAPAIEKIYQLLPVDCMSRDSEICDYSSPELSCSHLEVRNRKIHDEF